MNTLAVARRPVCLTIGGSDSCGGAGIQADLRVFESLGVQGCSAITALTAQNPATISRIEPVSLSQLDAEIHAVFDYYDVVAVKTGMLVSVEHVALVSALLEELHSGTVVVGPVMVSSSGKRLLQDGAIDTLKQALLPEAALLTPNLDEAALLLGEVVTDPECAAAELTNRVGCAVLLKGGHADSEQLCDILSESDGSVQMFNHPRQAWSADQTHGTGCRLASAVTANLAHQLPLNVAVEKAIEYLQSS